MGEQRIKLDLETIEDTLNQLRNSIDDLTGYTTTFRSNTQDRLAGFNSDFASKADALLGSMNNDVNQDLINKMEMIHEMGNSIFKVMQMLDEEIAEAIGGKKR